MNFTETELQLIYIGLHSMSVSYVLEEGLEVEFKNLLDKVSEQLDELKN